MSSFPPKTIYKHKLYVDAVQCDRYGYVIKRLRIQFTRSADTTRSNHKHYCTQRSCTESKWAPL